MVFPSVPVYLDPPNWHHHQQSNLQSENVAASTQLQQLPPLPPPSYEGSGGSGPGSIKPGSMTDRARQAKLLLPETVLKCPRCESTNTKFCYFNNYNLSQPRHFCKTCRRYWTRGGALRNVPVGGGCRRNKKTKNPSSSSSSSSKSQATGTIISSSSTTPPRDQNLMGHHFQPPQLPFLSSLQNLSQMGSLNLRGGMGSVSANNSIFAADQWSSVQQFPFLAGGFDQSAGNNNYNLFSFQNGAATTAATSTVSRVCEEVKMEETLNSGSGRQFLGISDNNNNSYYSSWNSSTDQLTGQQLSSSSLATTHFL